jgi:hypothetical protein
MYLVEYVLLVLLIPLFPLGETGLVVAENRYAHYQEIQAECE